MPKVADDILWERAKKVHNNRYTYGPFTTRVQKSGKVLRAFTVICPVHGEYAQVTADHLAGKGCKKCAMEVLIESQKLTLEEVVARSRDRGFDYTYKEVRYYGSTGRQPDVVYHCKVHGERVQNMYNHLAGKGCALCKPELLRDSFEEFVQKAREVHGDKYEYKELVHGFEVGQKGCTHARVLAVCSKHGEFDQSANGHLGGYGCPTCARDERAERQKITVEEALARWPTDAYSFVRLAPSTYSAGQRVVSLCTEHGEFEQQLHARISLGQGCPGCVGQISGLSRRFDAALTACGLVKGTDYLMEYPPEGQRKTWDFYFPAAKVAVELDGVFWHSSKYRQPNDTERKYLEGIQLGFRTIHLYEDELAKNHALCVRHVLNAVGMSKEEKIAARKCKIAPVSTVDASKFMEQHHIQGFVGGHYVGLTSPDGQLVAVAGFALRDSGRSKASTEVAELVRYATSCKVVGGLGRLIQAAQRQFGFKRLVSFSEIRLHHGASYEKLGFNLLYKTRIDYMYVLRAERKHKSNYQKTRLAKLYPGLDLNKTEKELTESLGLYRIYDCGKLKWEKTF